LKAAICTLTFAFLALGTAAQPDAVDEVWFLEQVRTHHPLMRRAATLQEIAEARELEARGAFDPTVGAAWKDKTYASIPYETQGGPELRWETPLGIGVQAGWNTAQGERLDASDYMPEGGLWSLGGTVRLGRGMWTDKRRATLAKAQAMVGVGEAERVLAENDVLLNASADYWTWYQMFLVVEVVREAEGLAHNRLVWSRDRLQSGEGAAIDTLEAHWNWVTRRAERAANEGKWVKARANVDRWLWAEDWTPAALPEGASPVPLLVTAEDLLSTRLWAEGDPLALDAIWATHPYRHLYTSKGEALGTDVRFRREMLKPQIDGTFGVFSPVLPGYTEWTAPNWDTNHRMELNVSMPLFLRSERGALNVAKLSQEQTMLDLQDVHATWKAQVRGTALRLPLLREQQANTQRTVDLARQLLAAEQAKFELGESSLFVVNSRENALLKAQKTHAEATAELHMVWRSWLWYLGQTDYEPADVSRLLLSR
jgi:outer membrane protein TolC